MVGIIFKLGSQRIGVVNVLLTAVGLPEVNFLGSAQLFGHVFVWTNVWQQMGWGTIIYLRRSPRSIPSCTSPLP